MNSDTSLTAYLRELGLSEYQSKVYASLLKLRTSTAKEIASEANVPQSRIYDVLDDLETMGFVNVQPGRPKKYGPIDPESAINQYKHHKEQQYEHRLTKIENTGEEFIDKYSKELAEYNRTDGDEIDIGWTHSDRLRVLEQLSDLCWDAESEILMITAPVSFERVVNHHKECLSQKHTDGITIRVLVAANRPLSPPVESEAREWCELRYVENIEGRIYMYDKEDILITFSNEDESGYVGLSTRSQTLYRTLSHLFELLWERSYRKP